MMLSRDKMRALAALFEVEEKMLKAFELIDQVAPAEDHQLLTNAAGVFWVAVGFSPATRPRLTIYVNGKWGSESRMWARLSSFVSHFGGCVPWDRTMELLLSGMKPLGMATTLSEGSQTSGRVYLSAYGNPLAYYEGLVRTATNERHYRLFMRFLETLLGEDCQYPLRSVVCSYGIGTDAEIDFKFEVCGHCALLSDIQAKEKCLDWLSSMKLDSAAYLQLLEAMTSGHLSSTNVELHSYIGLGLNREEVFTTIYLKPSWARLPKRQ